MAIVGVGRAYLEERHDGLEDVVEAGRVAQPATSCRDALGLGEVGKLVARRALAEVKQGSELEGKKGESLYYYYHHYRYHYHYHYYYYYLLTW